MCFWRNPLDVAMLELFLEEPVIEDEGDPQQEKPTWVRKGQAG